MTSTVVAGGSVLFGGAVPTLKEEKMLSFGWGFSTPGDDLFKTCLLLADDMGVKDYVKEMDKKKTYIGLGVNLIMADTDGDIAYMMLSP